MFIFLNVKTAETILKDHVIYFLHILQLLRKTPDRRLGSSQRDAEDIKKQPFYKVHVRLKF